MLARLLGKMLPEKRRRLSYRQLYEQANGLHGADTALRICLDDQDALARGESLLPPAAGQTAREGTVRLPAGLST
jgi:hypothetical protein